MTDSFDHVTVTNEYLRQIIAVIKENSPEDGEYMARDLLREFASKVWKTARQEFADEMKRRV